MRPTIVLVSPLGDHRVLVERLGRAGSYGEGPYFDQLYRGDCRFGVDSSGGVLDEFEAEEIAELSGRLGEISAISLEYSDVSCIRDLLVDVVQGLTGILDTNFGEFIEYGDVVERFRLDPAWDWRRNVAG